MRESQCGKVDTNYGKLCVCKYVWVERKSEVISLVGLSSKGSHSFLCTFMRLSQKILKVASNVKLAHSLLTEKLAMLFSSNYKWFLKRTAMLRYHNFNKKDGGLHSVSVSGVTN